MPANQSADSSPHAFERSNDRCGPITLALDLGTTTGWALQSAQSKPESGSVSFRTGRYEGGGIRYLRFRGWLDSMAIDAAGTTAIYFEEVNRMRLDPDAVARFAQGGLVRSLQVLMPQPMRFAQGGLVAGSTETLRPINLTIGAEHFAGLLAPDDVAQKLIRVAVSKQIRSAGRKPRYYGSGR